MNGNWKKWTLLSLIAGTFTLPPLTTWGKPPPWAPAHGYRAKYQYYYYPGQNVYYSPERRKYYYQRDGIWRIGVNLPNQIRLGDKVVIDLDTPTPYKYHPDIYRTYGK